MMLQEHLISKEQASPYNKQVSVLCLGCSDEADIQQTPAGDRRSRTQATSWAWKTKKGKVCRKTKITSGASSALFKRTACTLESLCCLLPFVFLSARISFTFHSNIMSLKDFVSENSWNLFKESKMFAVAACRRVWSSNKESRHFYLC